MNQTQTSEISSIVMKCGIDGCKFETPVKHENLTEKQADLLNDHILPGFTPTPEEDDHLHLLIEGQMTCPVHGKENLGYVCTFKLTATANFVINTEGEVT